MDATQTLRLFSDGRMSLHDARDLMFSMGHSQDDFTAALLALADEAGSSIRVGAYQKEEWQAEVYLRA